MEERADLLAPNSKAVRQNTPPSFQALSFQPGVVAVICNPVFRRVRGRRIRPASSTYQSHETSVSSVRPWPIKKEGNEDRNKEEKQLILSFARSFKGKP